MKKKIKMRYSGNVPVRIPGFSGHINNNDEFEVPVGVANNLDRDFFFEIIDAKKKSVSRRSSKRQFPELKEEDKNE